MAWETGVVLQKWEPPQFAAGATELITESSTSDMLMNNSSQSGLNIKMYFPSCDCSEQLLKREHDLSGLLMVNWISQSKDSFEHAAAGKRDSFIVSEIEFTQPA